MARYFWFSLKRRAKEKLEKKSIRLDSRAKRNTDFFEISGLKFHIRKTWRVFKYVHEFVNIVKDRKFSLTVPLMIIFQSLRFLCVYLFSIFLFLSQSLHLILSFLFSYFSALSSISSSSSLQLNLVKGPQVKIQEQNA